MSPADTRPLAGATADRTDVRNSEQLVALHGRDLRHVGTWGKWLVYDDARWPIDETGAVQERAVRTTQVIFAEAVEALQLAVGRDDEGAIKRAKADLAWAVKSQGTSRITAMIALARSKSAVAVRHQELDADPMLLNVANGTVDLRTGHLRAHRREDLITKLAPVAYDPKATCPTWDTFLDRAMGGSAELIAYLQRIVGYALTGEVREHVLGFFFGGGANGKSTFLGTIHAMLGDYAAPAPRGLLFRSRGERHPTELASLHGRRFVTCSEIEDGLAFDESLTKDLTGGDPISCRRMNEDFWSFQPTHKLFLAGNHKPTVRGDDEGIWRRMRLVPWLVTIPEAERDPLLPAKLRAELTGILRWAVEGCMAWQAKGLGAPAAVLEATAAYREENDGLGEFFRLHLVFEREASISRKQLRGAYVTFCDESGAEPFGAKRFAARLAERGITKTSVRTPEGPRDGWRGVRLATDVERVAAVAWTRPRSDVVTRSEQVLPSSQTHARESSNLESVTTKSLLTTANGDAGQGDFSDYLEREGIGGVE